MLNLTKKQISEQNDTEISFNYKNITKTSTKQEILRGINYLLMAPAKSSISSDFIETVNHYAFIAKQDPDLSKNVFFIIRRKLSFQLNLINNEYRDTKVITKKKIAELDPIEHETIIMACSLIESLAMIELTINGHYLCETLLKSSNRFIAKAALRTVKKNPLIIQNYIFSTYINNHLENRSLPLSEKITDLSEETLSIIKDSKYLAYSDKTKEINLNPHINYREFHELISDQKLSAIKKQLITIFNSSRISLNKKSLLELIDEDHLIHLIGPKELSKVTSEIANIKLYTEHDYFGERDYCEENLLHSRTRAETENIEANERIEHYTKLIAECEHKINTAHGKTSFINKMLDALCNTIVLAVKQKATDRIKHYQNIINKNKTFINNYANILAEQLKKIDEKQHKQLAALKNLKEKQALLKEEKKEFQKQYINDIVNALMAAYSDLHEKTYTKSEK